MLLEEVGKKLYRLRAYSPIPVILYLVLFGAPGPISFCKGLGFILLGETIRFWGVGYAGGITRSRRIRSNSLVTGGAYGYVRHPLYIGNFLLTVGFTLAANPPMPWSLILIILLFILQYGAIIIAEESYLEKTYGEYYLEYRNRVPMLLPYRGPDKSGDKSIKYDFKRAWESERKTVIAILAMTAALLLNYFARSFL